MNLALNAKLYIWSLSVVAILALAYIAPSALIALGNPGLTATLVIFSILVIVSEVYEVELVHGRNTSTGIAFCLAAILLGGTPLSMAVVLIGTLIAEIILRWGKLATSFMNFIYRVSFNTAQLVLSTFIGSLIFDFLKGRPLLNPNGFTQENLIFYNQAIPATGAFMAFALVNTSLVSGMLTLFEKTAFTYHLRFNLKHLTVQILSLGVLGVLMAVVYAQSSWNLLLVLVPLGLVHVSLRNYMKLRREAQKTFERMAELLNERDFYTASHSSEAADLAEKIARKLKLHQDEIEKIREAAIIHDIGKVRVPDRILQKPGPLTEEEWQIMKKHPDTGADLLKDLEMYRDIVDVVRHEHEHWDGSGYPKGLKGEEIPIGSRIVAAADIYNALTTDRPYRVAYSREEALQIMHEMRGAELDPQIVDVLISTLENAEAQATQQKKAATP